jgi:hypothetical protein
MATTTWDPDRRAGAGALVLPLQPLLWFVVLATAFLLRVVALDGAPLAPDEAARALEARALLHGDRPGPTTGPVPVHLMALSFIPFTASDLAARTPFALLGCLLGLTPLLFRARLGAGPVLGAAALLAISPVAILSSRTAGPAVLMALASGTVVGAVLLAQARADGRWLLLAGVGLAGGLGAGPAFIGQLLAIGLASALFPPFSGDGRLTANRWAWRGLAAFAVTAVVLDTLLLVRPAGLQAGLIDPFATWPGTVGLSAGTAIGVGLLFLHELLLITLALAGLGAVRTDPLTRFLLAWASASLLLALLTRAPDLAMAAGPLLPLALLGGGQLVRLATLLGRLRATLVVAAVALPVPMLFLLLAVDGQVNRGSPASTAPLLIAAGGVVAVALLVSTWLELSELALAGGLALAIGLLALHTSFLTELNYVGYQRGGPYLLSQSSAPAVRQVEARAADWWRQAPQEPIQVDSQLRAWLAWSLRDQARLSWTIDPPPDPDRSILGPSNAAGRPAGDWQRLVVGESYSLPPTFVGWPAVWRWLVLRESFFRSEPNAILITI